MVAIVVYDGNALSFAFDFKASFYFTGLSQTGLDGWEIQPQGKADGGGGQRIADIVTAGQREVNLSQFLFVLDKGIETAPAVNLNLTGLVSCSRIQAIRKHPGWNTGQ